ncbi:hypothetical protein ACIO6T_30735 [Streptomyces sp. NPDC087532]|uniref:hypothetical protein n=1 Tax=Streptomyces sp. NPDC087532 TaxID=3365795 RepID=UPI003807D78E
MSNPLVPPTTGTFCLLCPMLLIRYGRRQPLAVSKRCGHMGSCDDELVDYVEALVKLGQVTAEQWGLITVEQSEQIGVDASSLAHLTCAGVLAVAEDGVFRLVGAPLTSHVEIKAAWLRLEPGTPAWQRLAGDGGVVSHSSACLLHGLGDLPAGAVELLAASRNGGGGPGVRLHHGPEPEPAQITVVDGLPVTTVGRTITDLLRAGLDGGHVGGVVADSVRGGLVDIDDLAQEVAVFTSAYGLPESASGRDLIGRLLAEAGEQTVVPMAG